jgi:uncharacterized membrane-anchored protein YjiN (DUF445 family)
VTALFRRPLGLPIPHTALIPANWQLLAVRVGEMVGDRVLTKEYLRREIAGLDAASLIERAAARLGRAELEAATRRVAAWVAQELPASAAEELVPHLRAFLAARPVVPALAWALETARREGWDTRLVAVLAQALAEALERPETRGAVEDLVADLLARYRERFSVYPRVWFAVADLFGLIDRERIVAALRAGFRQVAGDPEHPLRQRLLEAVGELPERLRTDAALATRLETAKAELLASPAVAAFLADVAATLRGTLVADLAAADSAVAAWTVDRLDEARSALVRDAALRGDLEVWLKRHAVELIDRHHARLAALIEKGVHALGPEGAVQLVEEHAGDDLQYIRVNGTVVGGLAGGAIYAIHLVLGA